MVSHKQFPNGHRTLTRGTRRSWECERPCIQHTSMHESRTSSQTHVGAEPDWSNSQSLEVEEDGLRAVEAVTAGDVQGRGDVVIEATWQQAASADARKRRTSQRRGAAGGKRAKELSSRTMLIVGQKQERVVPATTPRVTTMNTTEKERPRPQQKRQGQGHNRLAGLTTRASCAGSRRPP